MDGKKKIIISHPNGNANTRAAVYGLNRKGVLYKYVTSIAVFSSGLWQTVSNVPGLKAFKRKSYEDTIRKKTVCFPYKELGRQICIKFGINALMTHETGTFCSDKESQYIDTRTANLLSRDADEIDAVYAYEDVALHSFREAKRLGKARIYDLPIGHWRAMRELFESERTEIPIGR